MSCETDLSTIASKTTETSVKIEELKNKTDLQISILKAIYKALTGVDYV